MEIIVEMLEEVVLYFCRYVIKNILKFFKNLMKIKNWIVVVEKFKEDEMYILLKKWLLDKGCYMLRWKFLF